MSMPPRFWLAAAERALTLDCAGAGNRGLVRMRSRGGLGIPPIPLIPCQVRAKRNSNVAASKTGAEPVEDAESDDGVMAVDGLCFGGGGGPPAARWAAVSRRACSSSSSQVRLLPLFVAELLCELLNDKTLPKKGNFFLTEDTEPSVLPVPPVLSELLVRMPRNPLASKSENELENESKPSSIAVDDARGTSIRIIKNRLPGVG